MTTAIQFNGAACGAHSILNLAKIAQAYAITFYAASEKVRECVELFVPARSAPVRAQAGDWLVLNGNTLTVYTEQEYQELIGMREKVV